MRPKNVLRRTQQESHDHTGAAPPFSGDEIAFRVEIGIGEMCVVVVAQMRLAIHRVREPDRERGDAEQRVEQGEAGRMAVQEFVLQRQIQARQNGENA